MREIKIDISLDNLTFGDLEKLDKASRNELTPMELIELLDRVVEGDVRELPLTTMPQIIAALGAAMTELTEESRLPAKND